MTAAGPLEPRFWRLEQPPPRPAVRSTAPMLLLIDRRCPLAPPLRSQLTASLSPQERRRHAALGRLDDREHFLLGRAALRCLLGAWLQLAPADVPIECGPHGKPRCPGGPEFNVSHSGDLILLGLHPGRPVGVDLERARPGLDWRPIARRVLPAAECEALERGAAGGSDGTAPEAGAAEPIDAEASAAEASAAAAFLAAWCRLEARLKARGEGFAGLSRLRGEGAVVGEVVWRVVVPSGYAAAAALASPVSSEGCRD